MDDLDGGFVRWFGSFLDFESPFLLRRSSVKRSQKRKERGRRDAGTNLFRKKMSDLLRELLLARRSVGFCELPDLGPEVKNDKRSELVLERRFEGRGRGLTIREELPTGSHQKRGADSLEGHWLSVDRG